MNRYLMPGTIMPSYLILPRGLKELDLSSTELWVYALLLDRARLSYGSPAWRDGEGRAFLYYPILALSKALGRSGTAVKNALRRLEEMDLIRRERLGQGKPNRIYVKLPEAEGWSPAGKPESGASSLRSGQGCEPHGY